MGEPREPHTRQELRATPTRHALHDRLLAPLVLGGSVRPVHAIGVRAGLAFEGPPPETPLAALVRTARLHTARRIVPVDAVADPGPAEWALGAALNDLFQSVGPAYATPLRRGLAQRLLGATEAILERVPRAATAGDALMRHTWFARLFELRRTDTTVSWWSGTQTFPGTDPPARLRAWPEARRVSVTQKREPLFDLVPIAVPRDRLVRAMGSFLALSPLTDFATCTRSEPTFAWSPSTIGFVAGPVGRRLALRTVSLLPTDAADEALGRATSALGRAPSGEPSGFDRADRDAMAHVLHFLSERALAAAASPDGASTDASLPPDAVFARALGAFVARASLADDGDWPAGIRVHLRTGLSAALARGTEAESFLRAYGLL